MIKLKNVKTLTTPIVADVKLVLIAAEGYADSLLFQPIGKEKYILTNGVCVKEVGDYLKPIFISETEKVEAGDKALKNGILTNVISDEEYSNEYPIGTGKFRSSSWCTVSAANQYNYKKVVALPENFSLEHLLMIVNKTLKNYGNSLIECYRRGMNSEGNDVDLTDGVIVNKDDYYTPKLNSLNHVTIFPIDGKLIQLSELENYINERLKKINLDLEFNRGAKMAYESVLNQLKNNLK